MADHQIFMNVIACALGAKDPSETVIDRLDYERLFSASQNHRLESLYRDGGEALGFEEKKDVIEKMASSLSLDSAAARLINKMYKNGIAVIPLKGLYLKELYAAPYQRTMGDVDAVLSNKDRIDDARSFLKNEGFSETPEGEGVYCFKKPGSYTFELHEELLFDGKVISRDLIDPSRCHIGDVFGFDVPLLDDCEHFIYVVLHMAKHYWRRGVGLRQLCDVFVFLSKKSEEIDSCRLCAAFKETKCDVFFANLLRICNKYFALDTAGFSGFIDFYPDVCEDLCKDLFECGTFGGSGRAVMYENMFSSSHGGGRLSALFPRFIKDPKYGYAMRHRALLPVAWVHRFFGFLFNRFRFSDLEYIFSGVSRRSRTRSKLLEKLRFKGRY